MKKLLAALGALLLIFAAPAAAQKSKAQLTTELATNWPDNTVGQITPAILRSTVLDIISSYYDLNGGTSLACAAHFWVSGLPTLSSLTCTQPAFSDISGVATGAQLPTPTGATLGGVFSLNCAANQWMSALATTGNFSCAQPSFSNLSGSATASQLPAGVPTNTLNTQTTNYTIQTSDCGKTVEMGTGATGLLNVTLPAVAGFAGTCTVAILNDDTARAKILIGFPNTCLNNVLNGSNGLLFPKQLEEVGIVNGAWKVTVCPGRWRPTAAVTFTINNAGSPGSDTTGDGLGAAGATSFLTLGHCMQVVVDGIDFSSSQAQPTCGPTTGQTYTESNNWVVPPTGTNTLNITGQGGAFTWKPAGANPTALLVGNNANIQVTNVTFSGAGTTCFGTNSCKLVTVHNIAVFETLAGVTCDNTGTTAGTAFCFGTDTNTAGGGSINIDNGLTVSGTIGNVISINNGTRLLWNSTLAASGLTINQIFQLSGSGTNACLQGNFATSGAFGAARQWVVLNNAMLSNVSAVAVPGGTAGCSTAATCAATAQSGAVNATGASIC